jgi:hypothetical protein
LAPAARARAYSGGNCHTRRGSTPSFRLRCQAILLKCEKRTSLAVAKELGCCEMSVNDWMKRFAQHGVEGLKVAKGRV